MDYLMRWIHFWDRQVRKFGIIDVKFAQTAAMFFAVILVKLFPGILEYSIWWFVAGCLLCVIRPWYAMLTRADAETGKSS